MAIDPWFLANLACPVDHHPLSGAGRELTCAAGHRYPVVDGVPVMLRPDVASTIALADASLRRARGEGADERAPDLHLESLGISDEEKQGVIDLAANPGAIDPVVAYLVAATNGLMYKHLIGSLDAYPIPELTMLEGQGRRFLDVGCSWGRWSVAAGRRSYEVLGIDPSLGAVMAPRAWRGSCGFPTATSSQTRGTCRCENAVDVTYSTACRAPLRRRSAAVAEMGRGSHPAAPPVSRCRPGSVCAACITRCEEAFVLPGISRCAIGHSARFRGSFPIASVPRASKSMDTSVLASSALMNR